MLEDDYSTRLTELLQTCTHDLVIPCSLKESLSKRGPTPAVPNDARQFARFHFNRLAILEFDGTLPAVPREHTLARVVTRNISRGGIAFLYSGQLYPGEQVTLWLPEGKHGYQVIRCSAHRDYCYEIAAAALNPERLPIDLEELAAGV